ncbi:MAG: hypothetical protein NT075_03990 [Chloroflexi bacterium]|nr:hypothetical protein [Chloroflexota bacterium]
MFTLLLLLSLVIIVLVWQRRNEQKHRRLVLRQLHSWIGVQAASDLHLQRWVNGLTAREADVLVDLLAGFCTSLNWELTWLFTPQLQKVPILKQAIEESVMAYARSILASLQLVEDVRAYNTYISLLQKPTGRKQFTLIQKLYAALREQNVISSTPKRKWFTRQPTRKQKINAVIESFDRDPVRAMETLKALLEIEAGLDVEQITGISQRAVGATPLGMAA